MSVERVASEVLGGIRERGTYRRMRLLEGAPGRHMCVDGRQVALFAGSNYLDLAHHPRLVKAAREAAQRLGCAAGGSRLIAGNLDCHEALERELAAFFGREAGLVFSTGYMANLGVIPALVGRGDLLVSDALNHASIVDGARLSRADLRIFAHADLDALEHLLTADPKSSRRRLVVVDGIYSMDGDLAPLVPMLEICRRHDAMLLLDDAHGTGTLGARGCGSAEHLGVLDEVDVILGTLGKSLGSFGAFVVGSRALRDLLVNTARSFIFSCALSPPQVAAARAALELVREEPWRRTALQRNAVRLRERLAQSGISSAPSTTHIVPVVVGESAATMSACEALLECGFYAQGIRFPSVPEHTARLRLTPMATHRPEEIDALAAALARVLRANEGAARRPDARCLGAGSA